MFKKKAKFEYLFHYAHKRTYYYLQISLPHYLQFEKKCYFIYFFFWFCYQKKSKNISGKMSIKLWVMND